MARLIYFFNISLDGYVNDATGNLDWTEPSDAVLAFINELERPHATYLYGRRLYETMEVWESMDLAGQSKVMQDYAQIWRAAEKIVFSRSLKTPASARTRIERDFDREMIRQMKASSPADFSIGGPTLAAHAIAAGLVDEFRALVYPVVLGGGTAWLPAGVRVNLRLLEERRFPTGAVYLRYEKA